MIFFCCQGALERPGGGVKDSQQAPRGRGSGPKPLTCYRPFSLRSGTRGGPRGCHQHHSSDLLAPVSPPANTLSAWVTVLPRCWGQVAPPQPFTAPYTDPIPPHSLQSPGASALTPTALLAIPPNRPVLCFLPASDRSMTQPRPEASQTPLFPLGALEPAQSCRMAW